MEYHFDRKLQLNTTSRHKNLYEWALNETELSGSLITQDQIPWQWSLYFTAKSCILSEYTEKNPHNAIKNNEETAETNNRQMIRAILRAGTSRDEEEGWQVPKYSMFGTSRIVRQFLLRISRLDNLSDMEECKAWGVVSYTAENDFETTTEDDCIGFDLSLRPDVFDRYARRIRNGSVKEINFSVGNVDGFYSEWSPSVSTSSIKVLANGGQQQLKIPSDCGIKPPHLGKIGSFRISFNSSREFANKNEIKMLENTKKFPAAHDSKNADLLDDDLSSRQRVSPKIFQTRDPKFLKIFRSIKRALWCIAALLILIFIFKQ